MKKEWLSVALIVLAFATGMVLTSATSGCDAQSESSTQAQSSVKPNF